MKHVHIYTDGCANPNPGASGAGIVMVFGEHVRQEAVPLGQGTNNSAELYAVVHALNILNQPCKVTVYTDSQLVAKCAMGEWKRSKNLDIWAEYDIATEPHEVVIEWIRKDSDPHNQLAHKLANEAAWQCRETI